MQPKSTKAEIQAYLNLLRDIQKGYWENQITGVVFQIMERGEDGNPDCSSVIVQNFEGVPDEYVNVPSGEYTPEEYDRLNNSQN